MFGVAATLFIALASARLSVADSWPFDVTEISAPDGSIRAKFVSIGATLTELWAKDKYGDARDVVLGYDNNTLLLTDPKHPYLNAIVGRYANRIKNGTFSIPITKYPQPAGPNVYHLPLNSGEVTLHGGTIGWDRRNWTIVEKTARRVTYKYVDEAREGFPGKVTAYATHAVFNGGILKTTVHATATQKTPIMITQHMYWNLDAFRGGSGTILQHRLHLDSSRIIVVDGNKVPTGKFLNVKSTPYDFRHERGIDFYWNETKGLCGVGCQGYDNAWVYDHNENQHSGSSLYSRVSGIRLDIVSNQPVVQVYTPNTMPIPRKVTHGGPNIDYGAWAAVAIEQEGYVDAINTPEWQVDQIYHSGRGYKWATTYRFSVVS